MMVKSTWLNLYISCDMFSCALFFPNMQTLDCGFNAVAWTLWIPPSGPVYCNRDSFDKSDRDDFVCYSENSTRRCGTKQ